MFKKIIAYKLKIAAKILLFRKKPDVIGITGSAGKTTTKELTRALLSTEFDVLASEDGYNTEIGAPLVLFGERVPDKLNSVTAWIAILWRCYKKAIFIRHYPEKVIVEMGADAPGDINYLSRLFRPGKGVILSVLPVHLASFKNIESVIKEKESLARGVKKNGKVFLNIDDNRVADMSIPLKSSKITFGTKAGADFRASNIKSDLSGLSFELFEDNQKQVFKVRLYGEQLIYSVLAAIAIARSEHISYPRIKSTLKEVGPTPGRMNIIEGKRGSIVIDDSYNANPESVKKALNFLGDQKGRRIALLGNMNELGQYQKEGHEQVGAVVAKKADLLLTVGDIAKKYLAKSAICAGMSGEDVYNFADASSAGEFLAKEIRKGDIVLVKGSQNDVRLEKAIEQFMAHPNEKEKILVRQSTFWQERE